MSIHCDYKLFNNYSVLFGTKTQIPFVTLLNMIALKRRDAYKQNFKEKDSETL